MLPRKNFAIRFSTCYLSAECGPINKNCNFHKFLTYFHILFIIWFGSIDLSLCFGCIQESSSGKIKKLSSISHEVQYDHIIVLIHTVRLLKYFKVESPIVNMQEMYRKGLIFSSLQGYPVDLGYPFFVPLQCLYLNVYFMEKSKFWMLQTININIEPINNLKDKITHIKGKYGPLSLSIFCEFAGIYFSRKCSTTKKL